MAPYRLGRPRAVVNEVIAHDRAEVGEFAKVPERS